MERSIVFKTRPMQVMEARLGRPLEDVLRSLYHDEGLTLAQVADRLDVNVGTVSRWMASLGIPARFPGPRARPE